MGREIPATLLGRCDLHAPPAPRRAGGVGRHRHRHRRGAVRRRGDQPTGRTPWPAAPARSVDADGHGDPSDRGTALRSGEGRRPRRCSHRGGVQARRGDRGHRTPLRPDRVSGYRAPQRRRRPLHHPADHASARARLWPTPRPHPLRCPLRHRAGAVRTQASSRRAVQGGGGGRRARPETHDSDRYPGPGRAVMGVQLRVGHDRHPHRGPVRDGDPGGRREGPHGRGRRGRCT